MTTRRVFLRTAAGAAALALPARPALAAKDSWEAYDTDRDSYTDIVPDFRGKIGDWTIYSNDLVSVGMGFPAIAGKPVSATATPLETWNTETGAFEPADFALALEVGEPARVRYRGPPLQNGHVVYGEKAASVKVQLMVDGTIVANAMKTDVDPTGFVADIPTATSTGHVLDTLAGGNRWSAKLFVNDDAIVTMEGSLAGAATVVATARRELAWRKDMKAKGATSESTSSKVVCTAMNRLYGFGHFRNAIWLAHARAHMSPAHERGYHTIGVPLVTYAYGGESLCRLWLRAALEHMARERTADLRACMTGGRRRPLGALYRAILEPLCRAIGHVARPQDPGAAGRL